MLLFAYIRVRSRRISRWRPETAPEHCGSCISPPRGMGRLRVARTHDKRRGVMAVRVTIETASRAEAELIAQTLPVKASADVVAGLRRHPPRHQGQERDERADRSRLAGLPGAQAAVGARPLRRRGAGLQGQRAPERLPRRLKATSVDRQGLRLAETGDAVGVDLVERLSLEQRVRQRIEP